MDLSEFEEFADYLVASVEVRGARDTSQLASFPGLAHLFNARFSAFNFENLGRAWERGQSRLAKFNPLNALPKL